MLDERFPIEVDREQLVKMGVFQLIMASIREFVRHDLERALKDLIANDVVVLRYGTNILGYRSEFRVVISLTKGVLDEKPAENGADEG